MAIDPDDPIIELANLVRDTINNGNLGVTAVRGYLPDISRKELTGDVKVFVIPKSETGAPYMRDREQVDWEIYVGILRKLDKPPTGSKDTFSEEQLDSMRQLVRAIKQTIREADYEQFVRVQTLNDPLYDPEHLSQQRQFTSVLSITYRGID